MKEITVNIERAQRHNPLDWFRGTGWKCSYEEYIRCYCPDCAIKDTCKHRECFRRVPFIDGGLNLCPNNQ